MSKALSPEVIAKVIAQTPSEHKEAYYNTDPKRVFNSRKCQVFVTTVGFTIELIDQPQKTFTGILVNGDTTICIVNGLVHCSDGPARIWMTGKPGKKKKIVEYWLNDTKVTFQEFEKRYLIANLKEYQEKQHVDSNHI